MSKTINLDVLKRAEKAGVRLVVDGPAWSLSEPFPLDPAISPARCDVVVEARRVANLIATRAADQPEGQVYGNSTAALEMALKTMLDYIAKHMPKGKHDAKQTSDAAADHQPDAVHGDDAPDTGAVENPDGEEHHKGGRRSGHSRRNKD